MKITPDPTPDWDASVLIAMKKLGGGPLTNHRIRAYFPSEHPLGALSDMGDQKTGNTLQRLKKAGKVRFDKGKWWLVDLKQCPTCEGRGKVRA